ncbi:Co2+/Mg2+ efflux protein ApaG [Jeongeupia naejangsanensis]|uniref:Protein ApaG n=1 Tax=Jeongeupia naejangsanensis TaxID=613195 RepID=A0ABS2BH43_9NEIS|nr:Co2+/Mg2+ efflux protein ApaG [Jeongeupia naejangsanensis]MBM3114413.1 Co2+/Mg2+ efflux protein ApaG [Jeongeupia naejangsanensis]
MGDNPKFRIDVVPRASFVAEQSDEEEGRFVFSYHIRITNHGDAVAQLVSRHWVIRDMADRIQEVRGLGVVGEQPVLEPGQSFEYMSGATLETPVGTMRGSYLMRTLDGTEFHVDIPEFVLSIPRTLH